MWEGRYWASLILTVWLASMLPVVWGIALIAAVVIVVTCCEAKRQAKADTRIDLCDGACGHTFRHAAHTPAEEHHIDVTCPSN